MKLEHFRRLERSRQQEHRRKAGGGAWQRAGHAPACLGEPSAPAAATVREVSRTGLCSQVPSALGVVLEIWDKQASLSRARLAAELTALVGFAGR